MTRFIKKNLLLVLTLCSFLLTAQKNTSTKPKRKYLQTFSYDLIYGRNIYLQRLDARPNALNAASFKTASPQLGIGYSNAMLLYNRWTQICHQMSLNYYLLSALPITDSASGQLSGFAYSLGFGHPFFKKSSLPFRLNVLVGFNTGLATLSTADNGLARNGFFAPKILVQPKFYLKQLCFSVQFNYCYDVSKQSWKQARTSATTAGLQNFDQSNCGIQFSVGYCYIRRIKTRK